MGIQKKFSFFCNDIAANRRWPANQNMLTKNKGTDQMMGTDRLIIY